MASSSDTRGHTQTRTHTTAATEHRSVGPRRNPKPSNPNPQTLSTQGGAITKSSSSSLVTGRPNPDSGRGRRGEAAGSAVSGRWASPPLAVPLASISEVDGACVPRNSKSGHQLIQNNCGGMLSLIPGGTRRRPWLETRGADWTTRRHRGPPVCRRQLEVDCLRGPVCGASPGTQSQHNSSYKIPRLVC